MWSHRRILAVVAAAVLATTFAYLVVRDPDPDADAVETTGESITTTTRRTTTTPARPAPTSSTTVAPTDVTDPMSATPAAGAVGRSSRAPAPATPDPPPPGCPGLPAVDPPSGGFTAAVRCVTAADLGTSWRPGCPVGPEELVAIDASHWGYDGTVHTGRAVVAASRADGLVAVFRQLFDAGFQIERMEPVDRYGSDDHASMVANNTSAFNCRTVSGSASWSEHAYGRAIDVNPLVNPYVKGGTVDPPEGAEWADREPADTAGMIHAGDAAVTAFAAQGWKWGGDWSSGQDYQHFSTSGR